VRPLFEKRTTFRLIGEARTLDKTAAVAAGVDYDALLRNVPNGDDYLVLLVRAVSAGEYWGPNVNHDYFEEAELIRAHETFLTAHVFKNHENKDVAKAIGPVFSAVYDTNGHCVILALGVDRAQAPEIVRGIERGYITDVSMGCKVSHVKCSCCGTIAYKPDQRCEHLNTMKGQIVEGKLVYEINYGVVFHDISIVLNGADKTAKLIPVSMRKTASAQSIARDALFDSGLERLAASRKDASFDKELELSVKTAPVEEAALRVHYADVEDRVGNGVLNRAVNRKALPDDLLDTVKDRLSTAFGGGSPDQNLPTTCVVLHTSGGLLSPRELHRIVGVPSMCGGLFRSPDDAFRRWFAFDRSRADRELGSDACDSLECARHLMPYSIRPDWADMVPSLPLFLPDAIRWALSPIFEFLRSSGTASWADNAPNWRDGIDGGTYGVYVATMPAAEQGLPKEQTKDKDKPTDAKEAAGYSLPLRLAAVPVIYAASAAARKREELGTPLGPVERALAYNPGLVSILNVTGGGAAVNAVKKGLSRIPVRLRGSLNRARAWSGGSSWADAAKRVSKETGELLDDVVASIPVDPKDVYFKERYAELVRTDVDKVASSLAADGLSGDAMGRWLGEYGAKVARMLPDVVFQLVTRKDPVKAVAGIPMLLADLAAFKYVVDKLPKPKEPGPEQAGQITQPGRSVPVMR